MIGPGSKLGRYHLIEPLGVGGMAAVYRAYDPMLDREVAIKILSAELSQDRSFRRRFQEEARSLGRVEHPNLVRIYAVGREGPISYYAMELLEGLTLNEIISARGRFSVVEALAIFDQFLQALAAVHRAGIIHRDIKPGNIMLDKAGRVVLMDFGLARRVERRAMTAAGSVVGTPEYMSPEQACGGKAIERSDLYAAGVLLYEMLAGRPPFQGKDTIAILRQHVETPAPEITKFVPDLPPALVRIVKRLLEKKPEERYPHVSELCADLAPIGRVEADQKRVVRELVKSVANLISKPTRLAVPPVRQTGFSRALHRRVGAWRWRSWLTAGAAVVAVLALLVAWAAFVRGRESNRRPAPPIVSSAPEVWDQVLLRNGDMFNARLVESQYDMNGRLLAVFEFRDGRTEEIPFSEISEIRKMTKGGDKP